MISVATVCSRSYLQLTQTDKQEMFIRYLAEQGHNVVKSERKPRKNVQYRDLGSYGVWKSVAERAS